ncbi:protease [Deinococcus irradiatisoli]|uniref:Protease n=2 Tax=Deinococcus irradiatisoli TaxID=2202254 RepID=A0A2Z3JNW9_9DEIO|nr:protease [Deinococcus irradiatisoli]
MLAVALSLTSPAFSQTPLPLAESALKPVTAQAHTASTPAATPSPAQEIFDEVNDLIQNQYGGLSTVDRAALARDYQTRLTAVCASDPSGCAAEKAFPVVTAEVTALGDEHTYFQNPDDFKDFMTSATGGNRLQFGVRLAQLDGESRLILDVIPGSASEAAGLRRGDVLKTIDDQPYTYAGLKAAKEAGRQIMLGLERGGAPLTVAITSSESSSRDLPRLSFLPPSADQPGQVAVIRIPTFLAGGSVAQTVHDEVRSAQGQQASGLIVDLRGNTGGDLSECDGAVSAFVPSFTRLARTAQGDSRTVVRGGSRLDNGRVRSGVQSPALWTGPLTVMVDGSSASCSEFFAYELQYAKRATIIGEVTAGVGNTATRVFPLDSGAALQLTILNYAKPDGTPYPVRVKPDVSGVTDLAALGKGTDTLLSAAVGTLKTAPVLSAESVAPAARN